MNLSPPQNRLYFCLVSLSFICNISLIPISLPYYQLKGISDLCISHYNIFFNMYKTLGTSHIVSVKESFIFSIFWYTKYTYFWLFKEFKVFFFSNWIDTWPRDWLHYSCPWLLFLHAPLTPTSEQGERQSRKARQSEGDVTTLKEVHNF